MLKKIIVPILVLIIGFVIGYLSHGMNPATAGRIIISPQELKNEIENKKATTPLADIVNSVESETGGQVVSLRIGRLRIPRMAYRMAILKDNPNSLELVVVHANTGKILLTNSLKGYTIVPAKAQRTQR